MAGPFTYLGGQEMRYPDYRDEGTGKMLIALPGESYSVSSVDPSRHPVPPTDGRWPADAAPPADPPPPPVLAFDFAPDPVPAQIGGEE